MDKNFTDLNIEEIEKKDITIPESKIRKGGKQPSGKPPLKHSNFYFCFNTGLHYETYNDKEGLKHKIREALSILSKKIEDEFMVIQGSQQGFKSYKLPIQDTREKLKLRIEGIPKVKVQFEIGKQTGLFHVHYLFAVSKRGLDTQLDNKIVKEFFDQKIGINTQCKAQLYRDAKSDIQIYSQKAAVI